MSAAELLVECPTCHRTHAANAGCDHGDESPRCEVTAPVGGPVTTFALPAGQADYLYRELCESQEECARLVRECAGLREAVNDLAAERDAALAVLRRLRGTVRMLALRWPLDQMANRDHDTIRDVDALLARHATPAEPWGAASERLDAPRGRGPSIVSDGLPVTCQGCGRTTDTLTDGRCPNCNAARKLGITTTTYPCGCRGTPGNRCPVHDGP